MAFKLGSWFNKNETRNIPPEIPADDTAPPAFVHREAVFNREHRIAGHLYRLQRDDDLPLGESDADSPARDNALLRSFCLGSEKTPPAALTAFLPLSTAALHNPWLERLPTGNTVLLLSPAPGEIDLEAMSARLLQLRERGLRLGVFRHPRHPAFPALLAAADFAAVNVAASQGGSVRDFSVALRSAKDVRHLIELFGASIETGDDQTLCQRCHFSFFHGPFANPTQAAASAPAEAQRGDPHKLNLIRVLNLTQGDAETAEIASALKEDPLLTFRILRYLNSPALGLARAIDSIDQALLILGRQRLARWLSVMLFSVREADFADWLLVESALCRGRIIELLGQGTFPAAESDHLFLTGVFSTLDRLLRIPLAQALRQLTLPEKIRSALLERQGPYAPLLAIAEACEAFDPARIQQAAIAAGIPAASVNQTLLAATAWASDVTAHWE